MRIVLVLLLTAVCCFGHDEWLHLHNDGKLDNWTGSKGFTSEKSGDDSLIHVDGEGSLTYEGDLDNGQFKNFELKFQVKSSAGQGGIFLHQVKSGGNILIGYDGSIYKDGSKVSTGEVVSVKGWEEFHIQLLNRKITVNVGEKEISTYTLPAAIDLSDRGTITLYNGRDNKTVIKDLHIKLLPDVVGFTGHKLNKAKDGDMKILLFAKTSWYRHPQIPELSGWLVRFLGKNKMSVDVSEDSKDINAKNLQKYKIIILLSTTDIGNSLDEKQRAAFKGWYQNGGGIVAMHAALVHHKIWDWYSELAGCDFDSDSEHTRTRVLVDPKAEGHAAVAGMQKSFWMDAEWLNFDKAVTDLEGVQVLLRADETSYDPVRAHFKKKGGKAMGADHPVSWIREWQGGRFFYTGIGHDERSTNTEFGRKHILGGINWAAGKK